MTTREFLDAFSRVTSHGWLDWEEALLLVSYAEDTVGAIVEVGSYMGRSAMLLAQLPDPIKTHHQSFSVEHRRQVICVDPWDDKFSSDYKGDVIYKKFLRNIESIPHHNVVVVRKRVEDWLPVPAGFVYLDGDHSYQGTVNQILKAKACNPKYIAIHDVCDSGGGLLVKEAATGILGPYIEKMGKLAVWATQC